METLERTKPAEPVLVDGAVYFGDNGRAICRKCAGASALYTGRDLSGRQVERLTQADVFGLRDLGFAAACEMGCTTLSTIVGPDGFPAVVTL